MADPKAAPASPIEDLKALFLLFSVLWFLWFINDGPAKYEASQRPYLEYPTVRSEHNIWADPFISEQYGELPSVDIGLGDKEGKFREDDNDIVAEDGGAWDGGFFVRFLNIFGLGKGKDSSDLAISDRGNLDGLFEKPVIYKGASPNGRGGARYIKLAISVIVDKPLRLTGFSIQNIFGQSVVVGGASDLPYQGRINEESDIFLKSGSVVYIIDGQSPIGVSFRLNKCIGKLSEYQDFSPPLLENYAGQGLVNLNYNDCVDAYKFDSDFYLNEWRIYLGDKGKVFQGPFDSGIIRILDSSGQALTSMSY